jgi:glutamate 5-kinase
MCGNNMPSDQDIEVTLRTKCANAKRIVVKVGTHVLVNKNGHPNHKRIESLVKQLCFLSRQKKEVILVSSGAIGAGIATLGLKTRPRDLAQLQMAASVGQTRLLNVYQDYFSREKKIISQVLLTHADLKHRGRHLNARNTMLQLLKRGIIPIVNENDVVAVDEIQIGDNDVLSALVATLVDADTLILLTTADGLRQSTGRNTQRVPYLETISDKALNLVFGKTNTLSTGGMKTKLEAAHIAIKAGIPVIIAPGKKTDILKRIIQGDNVGTLIGSEKATVKLRKRQRWISAFHRPEGQVTVDAGAASALLERGKSLLPVGITKVTGNFKSGALIQIVGPNRQILGAGLTEYNAQELERIKGQSGTWIREHLSPKHPMVAIHRDNLIIES